MSKFLGVVMDPIESLAYHKDTTLALLLAAQNHGYELFYMTQSSLFIDSEGPRGKMSPLRVYADENCWYELGESTLKSLGDLDVILMSSKKDDAEYARKCPCLSRNSTRPPGLTNDRGPAIR